MINRSAVGAIKGVNSPYLTPLDLVLSEYLPKVNVEEILTTPPSERRVRYYSHYFTLVERVSDLTGVDYSSQLKQKIERFLEYQFMAMAYKSEYSQDNIQNRLDLAANSVPGAASDAALGAIRIATNKRIPLREVGLLDWVDSEVLETLASQLFVNAEWLRTGEGAASPLISRTEELINELHMTEEQYQGRDIITGSLFVVAPLLDQSDDHYLLIQSLMTKFDTTETVLLRPIIKSKDLDRINFISSKAASNHQQVYMTKPLASSMNQYKAGVITIGELLSKSSIKPFEKLLEN